MPAIDRLFNDWRIVEHMPSVPWPLPADNARSHTTRMLEELAACEKSHWSIFLNDGSADLIGRISLWPDDGEQRDMRGFWLHPDYWGRGLMTEAADRVNDYALLELGWPLLWLSNVKANRRSAALKMRQGAERVGEEAKAYGRGDLVREVWLITQEAWRRRVRR